MLLWNMLALFANWRTVILSAMPRIAIPLSQCVDSNWLKSLKNTSATRLNKSGDKGQPCLRLRFIFKLGLRDPFTKTKTLTYETHRLIHLVQQSPKSIRRIMYERKSQLTLSQIFSKSNLKMIPLLFLFIKSTTLKRWCMVTSF